jgi:hypothetical protein
MVDTFRRPKTLVLVLALVLAFSALLMTSQSASASHDDCALSATAPSSYLGTAVISSGSVDCAASKNVLRFSIVLTRDGSVAVTSERTCHRTATCWSYVFDNDPPGDQRYCSTISARVGSHSLPAVTRCEEEVSP